MYLNFSIINFDYLTLLIYIQTSNYRLNHKYGQLIIFFVYKKYKFIF